MQMQVKYFSIGLCFQDPCAQDNQRTERTEIVCLSIYRTQNNGQQPSYACQKNTQWKTCFVLFRYVFVEHKEVLPVTLRELPCFQPWTHKLEIPCVQNPLNLSKKTNQVASKQTTGSNASTSVIQQLMPSLILSFHFISQDINKFVPFNQRICYLTRTCLLEKKIKQYKQRS